MAIRLRHQYYLGRNHATDARQILGNGRFSGHVEQFCVNSGASTSELPFGAATAIYSAGWS